MNIAFLKQSKLHSVLLKIEYYQMAHVYVLLALNLLMEIVNQFVIKIKIITVIQQNVSVTLDIIIFQVYVMFAIMIKYIMQIY
jgi:hypothetical protein